MDGQFCPTSAQVSSPASPILVSVEGPRGLAIADSPALQLYWLYLHNIVVRLYSLEI